MVLMKIKKKKNEEILFMMTMIIISSYGIFIILGLYNKSSIQMILKRIYYGINMMILDDINGSQHDSVHVVSKNDTKNGKYGYF